MPGHPKVEIPGAKSEVISCPNCGENHTIYHRLWSAITCQTGCGEMVNKGDFIDVEDDGLNN